MPKTLSTNPSDHPLFIERIGIVDGKRMFLHSANKGAGQVWVDRFGMIRKPTAIQIIAPTDEEKAIALRNARAI